jgi:hypothetical protein
MRSLEIDRTNIFELAANGKDDIGARWPVVPEGGGALTAGAMSRLFLRIEDAADDHGLVAIFTGLAEEDGQFFVHATLTRKSRHPHLRIVEKFPDLISIVMKGAGG